MKTISHRISSRKYDRRFGSVLVSVLAFSGAALAGPAFAQSSDEGVVVTGSRIVSNGFNAPTPVTTVTQDSLLAASPSNIPDALNQLPVFRGSNSNSRSVTWNANSPNQGNYLNLRGLGFTRTLTLFDGVRVPPTSFEGGVDANILPQALIQRVDVATGGASAAYGSDALVGVINYILDKNFTGVKGSAQGGRSSRGDGDSYRFTLAAGMPFADGRGHIEGSIEHFRSDPISSADRENGGKYIMRAGFTVPGDPLQHTRTFENVRFARVTHGGYINTGPLTGFEFLPGGLVQRMPVGLPTGNATYSIGGGGAYFYDHTLISGLRTDQGFVRASYDVAPNINAHLQATWAESRNWLDTRVDDRFSGTVQTINIFNDNAYLRPEVRAQLGSTTSFQMSRISLLDTPRNWASALNNSAMINAGLDGSLEAFGREWNWDVNYVHGANYLRTKVNEFNQRRFYAAVDAVVNPANGQIVCGVTLRNPGLEPNCKPLNLFGVGAPSKEAIDYVTWYSQYRVVNKMDILAANGAGDLFDLPGGPLSVAFGGEWRKQTLEMTSNSNPGAASQVDYTGIRGVPTDVLISNFTNVGVAQGEVTVKEGYFEVNAPLLADLPMVKSFGLNAAYRATDYSTSGLVHTWKVGMSYEPFDDLRFRGTVSRDITAPTLYQLFQGPRISINFDLDIHTGQSAGYIRDFQGNPNLTPEIGDMIVGGFVYSPSWLPGFTTSVDAYDLEIQDAIGATNQGDLNIQCENSGGTDPICQYISRPLPFANRTPANNWTRVLLLSLNQAYVKQNGFDVEMSYAFPLSTIGLPGDLRLRALAGFITGYESKQSAIAAVQQLRGIGAAPKASGSFEVNYNYGPFSARLSERFTGKSRRSLTQIDENYPYTPNVIYTDLNLAYKFGGQDSDRYEAFLNVQNLTDEEPPIRADPANPGLQFPTLRSMYDVMGRYFTAGVRFEF